MAAVFDIVIVQIALMVNSKQNLLLSISNLISAMSTFEPISILALLKSLELPKEQKSFEDDWKAKVNSNNSSYGAAKHSPHPDQTACRGLETVSLCTVRRS